MNMKKLWLLLLLSLVMVLAACEATSGDDVELSQAVDAEIMDGSLSAQIPDAWVSEVDGDVMRLASRADFLNEAAPARRSGDFVGGVLVLPAEVLVSYNLTEDDTMTEIANALAVGFGADLNNLVVSNPVSFTDGERRGAMVTGVARGDNDTVGRFALAVIDAGDAYGVVTLSSYGEDFSPGNYAEAIARTLSFNAG